MRSRLGATREPRARRPAEASAAKKNGFDAVLPIAATFVQLFGPATARASSPVRLTSDDRLLPGGLAPPPSARRLLDGSSARGGDRS